MRERAVLVTTEFQSPGSKGDLEESSRELELLSEAAGLTVSEHVMTRPKKPSPAFLLGKGKAEEVRLVGVRQKAHVVVFNASLSPTQQRNLEEIVGRKTIDRTQLILDIFAQRARSSEGKVQVELAQLKYLLPRLGGEGIYLSRLGGGVGTRGPGEQKLEVDRRRIRERITRLERELKELQERRLVAIEKKREKDLPLVALVGYTNAGKSSLFNVLTRSEMLVKNQLFSTLDTTTRPLLLSEGNKALLVDTVGFIRDLPHHLVESFKATLEETIHADRLLLVTDVSRADRAQLENAVQAVLEELGAHEKKALVVFNKADLLTPAEKQAIAARRPEAIFVSARTGGGLEALQERLAADLFTTQFSKKIFIPGERQDLVHFLYERAHILEREDADDGVTLTVKINQKTDEIFSKKLKEKPRPIR